MKTKSMVTALVAATLTFLTIPAATGLAGGGTVAGKCGTLASVSASNVTLSASSGGYFASPLQIRGNISNCSIYTQQYWIDFSEPSRPVPAGLNSGTTVTCTASFSLFNLLLSSGSSQGFSASGNITPTAVANPTDCVGTHTVKVALRSRTDGSVLSTVYVTYTVTQK